MKKRLFIVFILIFVLSFMLVACSNPFIKDDGKNNNGGGNEGEVEIDKSPVVIVDDGTRPEGVMSTLTKETFSPGAFLSDYTFEWIFNKATYRSGKIINNLFDYKGYLEGKKYDDCFYDNDEAKEMKQFIVDELNDFKKALTDGVYEPYGYKKDMDFLEFIKEYYSIAYGYKINNFMDVGINYCYQELMKRFYEDNSSLENVDEVYLKLYYADVIDEYLKANGYHLLVCVIDSMGITYLSNYTDAQKLAVMKLYDSIEKIVDKIIDPATSLEEGEGVYDFFVQMADLFTNANFDSPNEKQRKYLSLAEMEASSLVPYTELNVSVICEQLETTPGVMVEEFEKGVREMWDANIDRIAENIVLEEEMIHEGAIVSEFGYHFYVNTCFSLEKIYAEDAFLHVPSIVECAFFMDSYYGGEEYTDAVKHYVNYLKAIESKDTDKINASINEIYEFAKSLNLDIFKDLTLANLEEEFILKYLRPYTNYDYLLKNLKDGESINLDEVSISDNANKSVQGFFIDVYNNYAGQYYYEYVMLETIKEELASLDLEGHKEDIDEMMAYYLSSYRKQLTLINATVKEYKTGLLEKINKPLYDELMEEYNKEVEE